MGEYSPWVPEASFRQICHAMWKLRNRPPKSVQGRICRQQRQYRAKFDPNGVRWYWIWGQTDSQYADFASKLRKRGFVETSYHPFVAESDQTLHSSIWSRLPTVGPGGRIEGESLYWSSWSAGSLVLRDESSWISGQWSGHKQLLGRRMQPASVLKLGFQIEVDGVYEVGAVFTTFPNLPHFNVKLDDTLLAEKLDIRSPSVTTTDLLQLGKHELQAGRHHLVIQINGRHKSVDPDRMGFAIDYIQLKRAKN